MASLPTFCTDLFTLHFLLFSWLLVSYILLPSFIMPSPDHGIVDKQMCAAIDVTKICNNDSKPIKNFWFHQYNRDRMQPSIFSITEA